MSLKPPTGGETAAETMVLKLFLPYELAWHPLDILASC